MNNTKNSNADNEAAGRMLIVTGVLIAAIAAIAILPILIGGFLIGAIWYGAYVENGETDGRRLVWPIAITLGLFIWTIGLFPPFFHYYPGALFTDFSKWTGDHIGNLLSLYNSVLPRKLEIHNALKQQVSFYGWLLIPMATMTLVYLHFKGAGRGAFLYQGVRAIFTPLRLLGASSHLVINVAILTASLAEKMLGAPRSIFVATLVIWIGLMIYRMTEVEETTSEQEKTGKALENPNATVIGIEKGKPNVRVKLTESEVNHHVHVVGASGFGKSVLLSHITANRIRSGRGLMLVDLKTDFETLKQVASVAKSAGRTNDLMIFSMSIPEISHSYNVLENGSANQLKDRIMTALNWSEEFYKNEASSFLLKLFRGLVRLREAKGTSFDLHTVLRCLSSPKEISNLANELPKVDLLKPELEELAQHLSKTENAKALQGLKSQLEGLVLSDFGHLLMANESGINLMKAIQEQKIIYLLLDSRTYGETSKALGRLILQDLKAVSARIDSEVPKPERKPFSVVIDEFADMATEDFISFLDRARSSNIGVVVAHQALSDLERISQEFSNRLMTSTSTMFAFLQKLGDSSEMISAIAGTRKTKEVTAQAKSGGIFGDQMTGMKSIKEVDEFVIHPNVLRSLGVGECVMVQKYPSSKSMVVKVNPENKTSYLSDEEVRLILRSLAPKRMATKSKLAQLEPSVSTFNESNASGYWKKDNEL
jgi:hypothetical protein